jgi:hypothetical protein
MIKFNLMVKYNMEIVGYKVIEVTANHMYFVIYGNKNEVSDFVNMLNKHNKDINIKYMFARTNIPSSNKIDKIQKLYTKKVYLDNGTESSQCFALAEGNPKKTHMVMSVTETDNNVILGYPKLDLSDSEDPEQTILKWIKKNAGKLPKGIKKSLKPITLVGTEDDILLYIAHVN